MATTRSGTKVRSSRSEKSRNFGWSNDSWRKLAECGLTGNACIAVIASTVLHCNNNVVIKELYSLLEARRKVFLRSSSSVTLSEKNPARNVGRLWNLAGIFLNIDASFKRKKDDWKAQIKNSLCKNLLLFTSIFDLKMPITARFSIYQGMWMLAYILSFVERHFTQRKQLKIA